MVKRFLKWFFKSYKFKYVCGCRQVLWDYCGEHSPNNSHFCTLEAGHEGKHVACGTKIHRLEVWE